MPLKNLEKKIQALELFDIEKETLSIIRENSDTILSLIRGQMGSKGVRGDSKFIQAKYGNAYQDITVFNKENKGVGLGKKTDFVTMFMSGDFYASLQLEITGTVFKVTSNVPYFSEINDQWNDGQLTKLDKINLKYLRDTYIIPELKRRFKRLSNGV